ncbi:MAG: hypothetical protein ABIB71_08505 [Candidatus Woesearchaeota archaeon]
MTGILPSDTPNLDYIVRNTYTPKKDPGLLLGTNITTWEKDGLFKIDHVIDRIHGYVNFIAITPLYLFKDIMFRKINQDGPNTASLESMAHCVKKIREANPGIKIMLKPHIDAQEVNMKSPVMRWLKYSLDKKEIGVDAIRIIMPPWPWYHKVYFKEFLYPLADFAESLGIEHFCLGTELMNPSTDERMFRKGIAGLRQRYSGYLTYAAFTLAPEISNFWDDLDYMSINTYPRLTGDDSVENIEKELSKVADRYEKLADKYNTKIMIPEFGLSCMDGAIHNTGKYVRRYPPETKIDMMEQRNYIEGFLKVFLRREWFQGCALWAASPQDGCREEWMEKDFFWLHKPAEEVVREYYTKALGKSL